MGDPDNIKSLGYRVVIILWYNLILSGFFIYFLLWDFKSSRLLHCMETLDWWLEDLACWVIPPTIKVWQSVMWIKLSSMYYCHPVAEALRNFILLILFFAAIGSTATKLIEFTHAAKLKYTKNTHPCEQVGWIIFSEGDELKCTWSRKPVWLTQLRLSHSSLA